MVVTKINYSIFLRQWRIELDNGIITNFTSKFPPYKLGDRIISVWHFDNYCNTVLK